MVKEMIGKIGRMGLIGLMGLMGLVGCRGLKHTVEVPVVHDSTYVNHTEFVYKTDTIINNTETVIREANKGDSALLAKLGLQMNDYKHTILVLQKELEQRISELTGMTADSSYYHNDTPVPITNTEYVEVEKELTRWQKILMWMGRVGLIGLVGLIGWKTRRIWLRWVRR